MGLTGVHTTRNDLSGDSRSSTDFTRIRPGRLLLVRSGNYVHGNTGLTLVKSKLL